MGGILISDLDEMVIGELQRRVAAHGGSIEDEALEILAAAKGVVRQQSVLKFAALRRKVGGPSSLERLRADRDRD